MFGLKFQEGAHHGKDRGLRLFAISDLHVAYEANRMAWERLSPKPSDWLILGGDIGETEEQLAWTIGIARERFAKVIWIPGNHELWTEPATGPKGDEKYRSMVHVCRELGCLTPEDPYPTWPEDPELVLVPMFILYDYSFRPPEIPLEGAIPWAEEAGLLCKDEFVLDPSPYASRIEWCRARVDYTEERLRALPPRARTVLINHFPLKEDQAFLPAIPRFKIWCGTKLTEDWHTRFRAKVAVSGHLHLRSTRYREGVRFEEVSLGYPRQWNQDRGVDGYLREILPGPSVVEGHDRYIR